jgi:AraC-like DNA-binding protein/quercetin dioxygenase-like cupin family protein
MERIYRIILEQHLRRLNAEVTLAAWSSFAPGFSLGRSRPHGFRLVYITNGTGWVEVNGKRYDTRAGSLSLLPAGLEQSCGVAGSEPVEAYWVQFDANLGDAELLDMLKLPVCVDIGRRPDIVRLFEAMVEAFNDASITSVLRSKAALYEALACFLEKSRLNEVAIASIDHFVKLCKVLDYIDQHLADNLTLEELAKIAYLHPNYFVSLFKNLIGHPPIQYVNMRRLEKAKRLLEETDIHVSEIAAAVGMQNHYLSRLFKQHTGVSPTRYRRLYGEQKARAGNGGPAGAAPEETDSGEAAPGAGRPVPCRNPEAFAGTGGEEHERSRE